MKRGLIAVITVLAFLTSSASAEPTTATKIHFRNSTELRTVIGKRASNVQEALDSLSSSVGALLGKQKGTWVGSVYDVYSDAYRKSAITVTFKPSTPTSGSWTSSPFDVFSPSELFEGASPEGASGTWTGHYHIVGDLILASEIVNPESVTLSFGRSSFATAKSAELELIDTASVPSTVVILRKQ